MRLAGFVGRQLPCGYGQWAPADIISSITAPVSVTGTTAETNLAALRIPANSMGKNGIIEVRLLWSYTNSSNTKTFIHKLATVSGLIGGQFIAGNQAVTTTASSQGLLITRNNNATNAQISWAANPGVPFSTTGAALIAGSIDTTQDVYVNISALLASAAETVTLQRATAIVYYAP